eukprot:9003764-Pyramimonas_sp.AAC.1
MVDAAAEALVRTASVLSWAPYYALLTQHIRLIASKPEATKAKRSPEFREKPAESSGKENCVDRDFSAQSDVRTAGVVHIPRVRTDGNGVP